MPFLHACAEPILPRHRLPCWQHSCNTSACSQCIRPCPILPHVQYRHLRTCTTAQHSTAQHSTAQHSTCTCTTAQHSFPLPEPSAFLTTPPPPTHTHRSSCSPPSRPAWTSCKRVSRTRGSRPVGRCWPRRHGWPRAGGCRATPTRASSRWGQPVGHTRAWRSPQKCRTGSGPQGSCCGAWGWRRWREACSRCCCCMTWCPPGR
jgi:hypothetical protein